MICWWPVEGLAVLRTGNESPRGHFTNVISPAMPISSSGSGFNSAGLTAIHDSGVRIAPTSYRGEVTVTPQILPGLRHSGVAEKPVFAGDVMDWPRTKMGTGGD